MNNNTSAVALLTAPWGTAPAQIKSKEVSSGMGFEMTATSQLAPFLFKTGPNSACAVLDPNFEFLSIFDGNQNLSKQVPLGEVLQGYAVTAFDLIDNQRALFLCLDTKGSYSLLLYNWSTATSNKAVLGQHKDVHLSTNNALGKRYCWTVNDDYSGQLHELTFGAKGIQAKALTSDFPFASSYVFVHEQEAVGVRYFQDLNKRGLETLNLLSKAHQTIPCDDALYGALLYPIGISATGLFACYQSPKEGLPLGRVYTLGLDGKLLKQYDLHEELGLSEDYKLIPYDNWTLQADGQLTVGAYSNAEVQVLQLDITR